MGELAVVTGAEGTVGVQLEQGFPPTPTKPRGERQAISERRKRRIVYFALHSGTMTHQEIAEHFGVSLGTVRRLTREHEAGQRECAPAPEPIPQPPRWTAPSFGAPREEIPATKTAVFQAMVLELGITIKDARAILDYRCPGAVDTQYCYRHHILSWPERRFQAEAIERAKQLIEEDLNGSD